MHVSIEHIRELYDYLFWADRLVLEGAATIADVDYFQERGMSLGSIHKLLVHLMAAESLWLDRWQGRTPTRIESEEDYPTRAALTGRWPQVHAALRAFMDEQTTESLARPLAYRHASGDQIVVPLGEAMIHVVDHGSYHRGQLNTMIKQAGGKPVPAFYITYQRQKHAPKSAAG